MTYSEVVNMYTCNICSEIFSWPSGLSRHSNIHKNLSFQCDLCNKIFTRKDNLNSHVQRLHTADELYIPFNSQKVASKSKWQSFEKVNCCQISERLENEEVLKWNSNTNPNDIVELIRICIRLGIEYHVYINTLRDMGIIE